MASQAFGDLCVSRGKAVQSGNNGCLDAAELGKGLGVAIQRGLNLNESVFQLHNVAGEIYEIIRHGSNLAVLSCDALADCVAKVGKTGPEATKVTSIRRW